MFIFIIIFLISLYILMKDFAEFKESKTSSIELIQDVVSKESEEKVTIDWAKLEEINKDIIGWIKIDNTNINYPILKDNEELKYLEYSFDRKRNGNGSIFTISNNPFKDNVTVIHGHNMKSGIMFSDLSKYMNKDFLYEHSSFDIYAKNQNYKAKVFSCYSIGIEEETNNIASLEFDKEIEYYKKMSRYSIENVDEIKKIVKLSTCSYLNNHTTPTNQRYYIIAKLEEID